MISILQFSEKIIKVNQTLPEFAAKNIVFTNGCFDILHPGHLQYLLKARLCGDFLVVGLNSDESIRRLKGSGRPVNNFEFRSKMLSFLSFVDYVIEFENDTPYDLIVTIKPSILVKGADYEGKNIVGSDFVNSYGGKTILIDFLEGYSTTQIINKIQSKN